MSDPIVPVVPTAPVEPQQQPAQALPTGVPSPGAPVRMDGVPEVKPEVKPDVVVPQSTEDNDYSTGNAALDVAVNTFIQVTGASRADINRAMENALEYDNPALIDRAFIKERFGKHAAQAMQLAEAAVAENIRRVQDGVTEAQRTVHSLAGSEAAWQQAVSVFNSSANDTIKQAVKALMDSGNIKGGADLLLQTVNGSGLLPNVNPLLNGGSAASGAAGALTGAQFQQELSALRKEAGNRSFETGPLAQKYSQLLARRQAGKQLGI